MRILIDLNHPAHVHYYRNFIKIMEQKGHKFCIVSRNKEIEHYLLNAYGIPFISKGRGKDGLFGKALNYVKTIRLILKVAKEFSPDLLMGSPYTALASRFLRKPNIVIGDTDHAKLTQMMTNPFSEAVITPDCFLKDMGTCHIKVKSYLELCYLHPNQFSPDASIFDKLGILEGEEYVIIRFVAWNAQHDIGEKGLRLSQKREIVSTLSKKIKIFISSEVQLPEDLEKFKLNIPPERIHDVLYFSRLYIGEGATMASECAMLGVPAIYINSLTAGTLIEQEKYGLIYHFNKFAGLLDKALEILDINKQETYHNKMRNMLSNKIDLTSFLVWFVENFPESMAIMKNDPDYQLRFK